VDELDPESPIRQHFSPTTGLIEANLLRIELSNLEHNFNKILQKQILKEKLNKFSEEGKFRWSQRIIYAEQEFDISKLEQKLSKREYVLSKWGPLLGGKWTTENGKILLHLTLPGVRIWSSSERGVRLTAESMDKFIEGLVVHSSREAVSGNLRISICFSPAQIVRLINQKQFPNLGITTPVMVEVHMFSLETELRNKLVKEVYDRVKNLKNGKEDASINAMDLLLGLDLLNTARKSSQEGEKKIVNILNSVTQILPLTEEQYDIVFSSLSKTPLKITGVSAPGGSGKTLTIQAVILAHLIKWTQEGCLGDRHILVTSGTNVVVSRLANQINDCIQLVNTKVPGTIGPVTLLRCMAKTAKNGEEDPFTSDAQAENILTECQLNGKTRDAYAKLLRLENPSELTTAYGVTELSLAPDREVGALEVEELVPELHKRVNHQNMINRIKDHIIKTANVVISTSSMVVQDPLCKLDWNLYLGDEIGRESLPLTIFTCLRLNKNDPCSSAIVFGDLQQLSKSLNQSLVQTQRNSSIMDILKHRQCISALHTLKDQKHLTLIFRHPGFLAVHINKNRYMGKLNYKLTKSPLFIPLNWPSKPEQGAIIRHTGSEKLSKFQHESKSNETEVIIMLKIIELLKKTGVLPSQIAVLCPYTAQKLTFKREFQKKQYAIHTDVFHAAQGDEYDCLCISLVRSELTASLIDDEFLQTMVTTRMKSAIILLIHENLLGTDTIWGNYCNTHRHWLTNINEFSRRTV
jgi:hypothetical protein